MPDLIAERVLDDSAFQEHYPGTIEIPTNGVQIGR